MGQRGLAPRSLQSCPSKPAALLLTVTPAKLLVTTGLLVLTLGVLVYLTDRDAARAALIPAAAALAGSSLFGVIGHWLPSFAHPFAFSLFTAAVAGPGDAPAYRACFVWWVVNIAFETAQHPRLSLAIAEGLQDGLGRTWPARLASAYVLNGTFDVNDLVAATAGALAAALLLYVVHRLEIRHETRE